MAIRLIWFKEQIVGLIIQVNTDCPWQVDKHSPVQINVHLKKLRAAFESENHLWC